MFGAHDRQEPAFDPKEWRRDERFRLLVESVRDYAIFMLDPAGHVVSWNLGAERLKGYTNHEILGQHIARFYPEEDARAGVPERALAEAAAQGRFEAEGWRVRKDGTKFWANVVITAMRGPDGKLVGFAKVTRDLTERLRHEDDRVRRAEAEQALKIRDEFLSTTSHEIRTPITTLRLQTDGLLRALAPVGESADDSIPMSRDRLVTRLKLMQSQCDRLQRLVDELLDHSRIASGRLPLHRTRTDLAALVNDAIERLADLFESRGYRVTVRADPEVIGEWDPHRVDQVVTNLLSNAVKYGEGEPIDVELRSLPDRAVLRVTDHGIGIAKQDQDRVFEQFERAVDGRHISGIGLGLWITRQIVTAHQGTIRVESEPGRGATFTVELPKGGT